LLRRGSKIDNAQPAMAERDAALRKGATSFIAGSELPAATPLKVTSPQMPHISSIQNRKPTALS
jgi:hypothetical protein